MSAFRVPRYEWLTAVAAGGLALACAGVLVVLKRNKPEMPRVVTLSFTPELCRTPDKCWHGTNGGHFAGLIASIFRY
jgi:hypothetical protein